MRRSGVNVLLQRVNFKYPTNEKCTRIKNVNLPLLTKPFYTLVTYCL